MRVKKKMTGLTMAVLLSLGQGGHAAEVGPEPLMNFTLDEIVVTATRTERGTRRYTGDYRGGDQEIGKQ